MVGVPIEGDEPSEAIVKFSRVAATDGSLEREDRILRQLYDEAPDMVGVPQPKGTSEVAGRPGFFQSAVYGRPLNSGLSVAAFADLGPRVAERMLALALAERRAPDPNWRQRLIELPLERFEHRFGNELSSGSHAVMRSELARLPELLLVWEHRDLGIWNVVRDPKGGIGIHDWEFAEPRGLPVCDLAFFLATAAFEADGVLAGGARDPMPILASNERLLDPNTETGAIATSCLAAYSARLGIGKRDAERLRLLGWVIQALGGSSDPAENPSAPDSLRPSVIIGFLEAEIRNLRVKDSSAA